MDMNIGIIIGAALADSVNPCVFGVLIFLLAFMTKVFKTPRKMLLGGLFYTLVVYATYLALGFGILKVTVSTGFSSAFYTLAAIVAIIAGVLEVKDYFWYGKGFSLQIIPGAAERIKKYTKAIGKFEAESPLKSFMVAAGLGVFVVMVELPCTGAPYLAVLGMLSSGDYATGIPMLLIYNLIFILPLIVIMGIMYFGTSSKKLESWRKEHRGLMRLGIGLFLVALGSYMIWAVI